MEAAPIAETRDTAQAMSQENVVALHEVAGRRWALAASARDQPEEFLDAGDQGVVIYRAVGRGKGSGIAVERRNAHLWTIRDGRAVRLEIFATGGVEAAGLSE